MNEVKRFKAMADDSRQDIIKELKSGEKCACKLLEKLNISQSTLSHHMQILIDADIVKCRKEGKWCHYSLNDGIIAKINNDISELRQKPKYFSAVIEICLNEKSKNPIKIFNKLAGIPDFAMMGIFHHIIVGSSLLTAYYNCKKDIDLKSSLIEFQERAKIIPPMACAKFGSCGAAVSAGVYVSVAKNVDIKSNEFFALANGMTSKVLSMIEKTGGPRCCKRHSYFALLAGIEYSNKHLGTNMESSEIKCTRSNENDLCIGKRCPFKNNSW